MAYRTPEERVGTVLADRYRVEEIIGRGGMGVVFAARHTWTDRPVALKILRPHLVDDEEVARRFLQEARAAAALRHPNVVDVLDMGRAEDGTVFIALERLEGSSLADIVARADAPLSVARAMGIVLPILDALGAAHAAGIVHRDVKPENIFLSRGANGVSVPKLLDFGIAKLHNAEKGTGAGVVLGTPQYMAPEQAMGGRDVGPQADVWAAGAVLYTCLTLAPPIPEESVPVLLVRLLTEEIPSLGARQPALPPPIVAVVDRALLRAPASRFADARAFAEALRAACARAAIVPDDTESAGARGSQRDRAGAHATTARPAPPDAAPPSRVDGKGTTPALGDIPEGAPPRRSIPGAAPLRVTAVRPYGARIRGRVFPLLEAAGLVIHPADVIPQGTSDADAIARVLESPNSVLLIPFHGHEDSEGRKVHGLAVVRELQRARPSFPWRVVMPVSAFGAAAVSLALDAKGAEALPEFVRSRVLVLHDGELDDAATTARIRAFVRDGAAHGGR